MSLKKKLMVVAAGTALTAGMAVPAMALENEFHGSMAVRATNANYNTGATGYLFGNTNVSDSATTKNWVEQRTRLFYSAKANDNLKLVTGFEIDSTWGKSSYVVGRGNDGGALGADSVNLETKWIYLDFNEPATGANFKAGLQGLNDAYKGIVVGGGADAAGLLVGKAFGPVSTTVGWFRLDDRTSYGAVTSATGGAVTGALPATTATSSNGKATRDLLLLDAKYALSKDIKVGASYYFLNSDKAASNNAVAVVPSTASAAADYNVHMVGLNAGAAVGPVAVDGFALYQFGSNDTAAANKHVSAFAANVAAKMKVGPGTAKIAALYVSGGSNGFININNENSAAFSENSVNALGNMFLLVRNSQYTTNDQYIAYSSDNLGMGIIGGSVGYDAKLTDKLYANVNAGMLATAKEQAGRESKYQGTEINAEVGYKVFDALTASVQGAYVILGDFYKNQGTLPAGTDPSNPYVARVILSYVF